LNSGLWTSKYDDVQKSMYAYGEGLWVGYDNVDTFTIRVCFIDKYHYLIRQFCCLGELYYWKRSWWSDDMGTRS
jgi:hypothetical protein